jgi:hypothetical protein
MMESVSEQENIWAKENSTHKKVENLPTEKLHILYPSLNNGINK